MIVSGFVVVWNAGNILSNLCFACIRLQPCLLRYVIYTCAFAMAQEEVDPAELKAAEDALVVEFQDAAQQKVLGDDADDDPVYDALVDALNGKMYMRSALGQQFKKGPEYQTAEYQKGTPKRQQEMQKA